MVRVSVLGMQQVTDDRDGGVAVRSSRALALVAYLAVHAGLPHPRQRIAGLLWPESSDAQALTNLRRELHHLRQVLGEDGPLQATPRDLRWADTAGCEADVRVFDVERTAALAAAEGADDDAVISHGAAAIAQYCGELLPGIYDDWAVEARDRLERQCVELCDLAGAMLDARRRIELKPLEETGYRVLMGLQAEMGDRAAAVSTYHHCASVLERELGVVPPEALWNRKACAIVWCYTGPHDKSDEVLEPVRSFGSPLLNGMQAMPFSVLQSAFDPLYPPGPQWYWKADFFNVISDEAIDVHVKYGAQLPNGLCGMHLYPIGGAAGRVPADTTAFAYRDGGWAGVIVGVDPDPGNAGLITRWAQDYWQELHPTSADGAYINFMMAEGDDRIRASYRGNYDRLAQVKRRYDPGNAFHVNQNIKPAG
jgi:DNA-binding SARP family transcriptional activator